MEDAPQENLDETPLVWGAAPRRARRRWRLPALALALVVVAAGAVATMRLIGMASPALDLPLAGRLALLPFSDATADRSGDWIEQGLMEMVAETVSRTAVASVVSPDRLRKALEPRALDLRDPAGREHARRFALAAGADQVLDATMLRKGDGYALKIELFDATGPVADGRLEGADPLKVADSLAFSLGRGLTSDVEPRRIERFFSRSPFLDRLYATGVQALRVSGPEAARPYFEIALEQLPGFLQARARLADCARQMGDLERARELADGLLQAAQSLGERALAAWSLRTLALLAALEGELDQASDLYSQAYAIHIDRNHRPAQAEVLFELARLALADGKARRAEELYVERLQIQQDLGDRLGEADTLFQIGSLLLAGGDLDGAGQVLTDARELSIQTGDVWTEMRLVASLGEVARRHGKPDAAKELWRRALSFYEQRQETSRRLLLSYKLAETLVLTDELDEAEDRLHDLRELAAELGDRPFEAKASLGLAWLLLRTGYPYQAKPHLDRTLELDRWLDDRLLLQLVIAWYAYEQGNYRLAVETQTEAKRRTADRWAPIDEAFLQVYRQAEILDQRLPLPGEEDYVARP